MVYFLCGKAFPTVHNLLQVSPFVELHKDMNMVGHDDIRMKNVTIPVKILQGRRDNLPMRHITKEAFTMSCI